jgi:peptide-methionine (R)-S-oxide reductase
VKTEDEWRAQLGTERYRVLREKGTEPAWTGTLLDVHDPGLFRCAGCGAELFRTDDKFDSGSGWPSFTRALADGVVTEHEDRTHGMRRTEVTCTRCGPPRPRLPRRSRPDRPALLHELPLPRVRAGAGRRVKLSGGSADLPKTCRPTEAPADRPALRPSRGLLGLLGPSASGRASPGSSERDRSPGHAHLGGRLEPSSCRRFGRDISRTQLLDVTPGRLRRSSSSPAFNSVPAADRAPRPAGHRVVVPESGGRRR